MVLFAKLEEEAPFQPINMSPTLSSLITALKQRFPQLQTLKVPFPIDEWSIAASFGTEV
jgi:hypothetical protein